MTAVEVTGLTKHYGKVAAIDGLDLRVEPGEMMVLLGPSGCGKTTLLRCISGLERPDGGEIAIGDTVVFGPRTELATHKRDLGMVFQNYALWPHMTVRDNVAYPLRFRGRLSRDERRRRAEETLELVECGHLADRLPSQISGGQQQRIALARALVGRPELILFDEPLSNLDYRLRAQLRQQLRELHRSIGFTGMYVTHDQTEALQLGTRIAVLDGGRLAQVGTPEKLFRTPRTPYVADFLGIDNRLALVRDGSGWTVNGEPVQVRGSDELPGDGVDLYLRSSDIAIGPAPDPRPDSEVTVTATVVDKVFAGEGTEWILALGEKRVRVVTEHDAVAAGIDDRVPLRFDLKRSIRFARS